MSETHEEQKDYAKLHDEVGGTENGACLWGHGVQWAQKSCRYRYQARQRGIEDGRCQAMLHSYSTKLRARIKTSAFKSKQGNMTPGNYWHSIAPPGPGDWDVEGPPKPIRRQTFDNSAAGKKPPYIPAKQNFKKNAWPYWNEAHHLIPKAELDNGIGVKTKSDVMVGVLVRQQLLRAKYNVNHKENMIFLPVDAEVSRILGLPRHLQKEDAPGVKKSPADHPVYTADLVKVELDVIIDDFKKIVANAKKKAKDHELPQAKLAKQRLIDLSGDLFAIIETYHMALKVKGAYNPGFKPAMSLDAMAAVV